jgi:hypothetical protein
LDIRFRRKALVDVGVSVNAADRVVFLAALQRGRERFVIIGLLVLDAVLSVDLVFGAVCFAGFLSIGRGWTFPLGDDFD